MKRSSSQTSLLSQVKTANSRPAVTTTLRRQTSAATTARRGLASGGPQARTGQGSSITKRQTIASKPPTSVNKHSSTKASANEPVKGFIG